MSKRLSNEFENSAKGKCIRTYLNIHIQYNFCIDNDDKEKQSEKKQKLSFGMMKPLPTKTGIKITLNTPATVNIHSI